MSTLMKEGLVNFIEPQDIIENIDEFGKPFIEFIKSKFNNRSFQIVNNATPRVPIHVEKLGSVADELVSMNLAICKDYPWYEMDGWVANSFMTYLASYIGSLPKIDSAPITNNKACFRLLGGYRGTFGERTNQRNEILKHIMPFPKDELSLKNILIFKERHRAELARFRDHIEGLSINLANLIDQEDRDQKREITIQELHQEIDEISSYMKETWHKIILLDILPIMIAGSTMTVGIQTNAPATTALGAASLMGAISQSIYRRMDRRQFLHRPLAYGALLDEGWQHLKK